MKNKKIHKILVVYKGSIYQRYVVERKEASVLKFIHKKHKISQQILRAHKEHTKSLQVVKKTLDDLGVAYDLKRRIQVKSVRKKYDLVITVGGDGTFLKASHVVHGPLIMGVNSNKQLSVGALLTVTADQFKKKISSILKGKYKTKKLNRLQIKINGQKLTVLALNDVLMANNSPAAMSRYLIKIGGYEETQRSSGIWIATACGSTAAIYMAGGVKIKPTSNKIQYFVREPFRGGKKKYLLTKGILDTDKKIILTNKMIHASLFIDGIQGIHPLHFGDRIEIKKGDNPLEVIV